MEFIKFDPKVSLISGYYSHCTNNDHKEWARYLDNQFRTELQKQFLSKYKYSPSEIIRDLKNGSGYAEMTIYHLNSPIISYIIIRPFPTGEENIYTYEIMFVNHNNQIKIKTITSDARECISTIDDLINSV
jgi:hypothetical protein